MATGGHPPGGEGERLGPPQRPHRTRRERVEGRLVEKLGDIRYVYTWRGERVFKVVSFFLVRYMRGRLGDVPEAFRHEVAEARWLPLADAPRLLSYKGEREMAEKALQICGARAL
jgi:hypothetical protein